MQPSSLFSLSLANRHQLFASLEGLLCHGEIPSQDQQGLFGVSETRPPLNVVDEWSPLERLGHEFSAVGCYLQTHPLDAYMDHLQHLPLVPAYAASDFVRHHKQDNPFPMVGILVTCKQKKTKSGQRYALFTTVRQFRRV